MCLRNGFLILKVTRNGLTSICFWTSCLNIMPGMTIGASILRNKRVEADSKDRQTRVLCVFKATRLEATKLLFMDSFCAR